MTSQFPTVIHAPSQVLQPPSTTGTRIMFPKLNTIHPSKQSINQMNPVLPFLNGNLNSTAYASVLESCNSPNFGKQVHAHLLKNGFHMREFVATKLFQMYAKCGSIRNAAQVFDKMTGRNLYSYTALLNVFLERELHEEAFMYFERLMYEDIHLEFFIFPVAFKICGGCGGVELGKQLHAIATKTGVLLHAYVGNVLIDMYGKCGSLSDAKKVFYNLTERDCVSWNSMVTACAGNGRVFEALDYLDEMLGENDLKANSVSWSALIGGFAQNGYDEEAIKMMYKMKDNGVEPNARILSSVLPACARLRKLRLGKEIYGYITRKGFMSSPYIVNGVIDLYRRCGIMEIAYKVFDKFSVRDVVSFNTMITGYCENGEILKAKELFTLMESKDLISWNSMVTGYAENLMLDEAISLFIDLMNEGEVVPDSFTLGSILNTCSELGLLRLGKGIHSYCKVRGLQSNPFVGGALVDMYCKFRDLEAAEKAFNDVHERDIVIWNALISGYANCNELESIHRVVERIKEDGFEPNIYTWNGILAGYVQNGHFELALKLFSDMQISNLRPDIYTVGIALPACARLATIERGKQIHACAIRYEYDSDMYIGAALVDMYAKCGVMKYAELVYFGTQNRNLVIQNAMLNAYAMHGYGEEGIAFFNEMLLNGYKPDNVTFLSVLSSCIHAGSIDTGQELFDLMGSYDVIPTLKHYTCLVDLLSRGGQLQRAYEVVKKMPMNLDTVIWGALLGGCIMHGDVGVGEIAARRLIELEPENSSHYVMLANLYASTGKWCELREVRQQMKDEKLHKNPGCSWIEDRDKTKVFMACDKSHKRSKEIYEILDRLTEQMRLEHV